MGFLKYLTIYLVCDKIYSTSAFAGPYKNNLIMKSLRELQNGSVDSLSSFIQENPGQVFNTFLAGVGIRKVQGELSVMAVNYVMPEQEKVEQRLPGGCLKPEDVVLALHQMNGEYESLRKKIEMEAGFMEMDQVFVEGLNHEHVAKTWEKFTGIILQQINPMSSEFELLVRASYDNALTRELSEEVSAEYKTAYICAIQTAGHHKKIGCLLTGFKSPEMINSSSEDDIESAVMVNIHHMREAVAPRHRNYFRAACGLYAQMYEGSREELSGMTT